MPRLLTSGALCRCTHLLIEWHLNALPPSRRLGALAIRHALEPNLRAGCDEPPAFVEHDEYSRNNFFEKVDGLWELALKHNDSHRNSYKPWDKTRRDSEAAAGEAAGQQQGHDHTDRRTE